MIFALLYKITLTTTLYYLVLLDPALYKFPLAIKLPPRTPHPSRPSSIKVTYSYEITPPLYSQKNTPSSSEVLTVTIYLP